MLFFPFPVHGIFSFSSQFTVQDKWAKRNHKRLNFLSSLACYLLCVHSLSIFPDLGLKEKLVFPGVLMGEGKCVLLKKNVYSKTLLKMS